MKSRRLLAVAVVVGAGLALALGASANKHAIQPIPAFSSAELTATPTNNWILPLGNIMNQRYSALAQINKGNVGKLRIAWHQKVTPPAAKKSEAGVSQEASPVAYGGTLYLPDGRYNTYALDATTGERLWYYKPDYPKGFTPLGSTRGVAIGDGKVYLANANAHVVALDQASGRVKWDSKVADWKQGSFFSAAPVYWNDMIITATSGGDWGARCQVVALNAKTGKIVWRFYVIPNKGEPGFDTWPAQKAWNGGGAMWNEPSLDPKLGLVYIGVGNPIPYSGLTRGAGDELFTDSLIALDAKTGKLRWHFQAVHHDLWDYDFPQPSLLFDLKIKGVMRKAVGIANKNGWVYILDRRTGKSILGVKEKPVPQSAEAHTAATQPFPVGQAFTKQCASQLYAKSPAPDKQPYKIGCIYTPVDSQQYTAFAPSAIGGVDWPPSSFSQRTGYMYLCSKNSQTAWKALPPDEVHLKPLSLYFGIDGLFAPKGSPSRLMSGTLVAMNMRSNRISWMKTWPNDLCYSGVLSTRGGLVFVGRNDGRIQAYDDLSGKLLWQSPKLRAGANSAPITYTVNGKQYLVIWVGGNAVTSFATGAPPKFGADLYAFALPS